MRRKALQYLVIQQFTFLVYFVLTTLMFFLALGQGNEGVTFRLFGGGDDGYFYWIQAQDVNGQFDENVYMMKYNEVLVRTICGGEGKS